MATRRTQAQHPEVVEDLRRMTPLVRYVNVLVYHLVKEGGGPCTIRRSAPLPEVPKAYSPRERADEIEFHRVCNRLKVIAGLNPVAYKHPVEGAIHMRIAGKPYVVRARFEDREDDYVITLTVSQEAAGTQLKPAPG